MFTIRTDSFPARRSRYDARESGDRTSTLTSVLLLAWWVGSLYAVANLAPLEAALDAAQHGVLGNQFLVATLALLGLLYLPRGLSNLQNSKCMHWVTLLGAYIVWALLTFAWSIDLSLSVRRLVAFVLLAIAGVGIGAGFYGQRADGLKLLARHVLYAGFIAGAAFWIASFREVGLSNIMDPLWMPPARVLGATIIFAMDYALVALIYLDWGRTARFAVRASFLLAPVFLLKSRALAVYGILGALLTLALLKPKTVHRAVVTGFLLVSILLLAGNLFGYDPFSGLFSALFPYVARGENPEGFETLTGRVPLWNYLIPFVLDRPWTGYGFGAFWTPRQMYAAWKTVYWQATFAHNGFLDETLGTGLIGLILFMSFWLVSMGRCLSAFRKYPEPFGVLVFVWMFQFLLFNSFDTIMQSYFKFPFYASLIALFALAAHRRFHDDSVATQKVEAM